MENKRTRQHLDNLYEVGKTKSLGYLPLSTLTNISGSSIEEMARYAKENSLKYLVFEDGNCNIDSGAMYIFDESSLMGILSLHANALDEAGVPRRTAEEYVTHIAMNIVWEKDYPDAYIAIGKTFNDKRFRNHC